MTDIDRYLYENLSYIVTGCHKDPSDPYCLMSPLHITIQKKNKERF